MIAGLDLSLTSTGLAACALDWDGVWSRVSVATVRTLGKKEDDLDIRALRLEVIANAVLSFCREHEVRSVWIESPAFSRVTAQHALGELHGVVKSALLDQGIPFFAAQQSTARKVLLGKVPRQGAKEAVQAALIAAGAPRSWSPDEYDAMAVLNLAFSEHGAFCFCQRSVA